MSEQDFNPFDNNIPHYNSDMTDINSGRSDVSSTPQNINGYNYQTPQPREDVSFSPNVSPFNGYGGFTHSPAEPQKKPAKEKKIFNLGKVIAISIITALIASIVTCSVFMLAASFTPFNSKSATNNTSNQSGTTTQIIVDSTVQSATEAVAQKVSPSVVGVVVTSSIETFFFGNQDQSSQGSGIIYSADGYIITNYHVIQMAIEGNGTIAVYLSNDLDTGIDAKVIGYDVSADIALLKVDKKGLPAIEMGDSSTIKVGQTAIAVGNPGGMDFYGSISEGIISGLNRTIQLESSTSVRLIQTDAAINPGNSGGALVNTSGQLIGVNSAKLAATGYEGMGFAIPSNDVKEICDRIINKQGKAKPYLGIDLSSYYTSDLLQQMGYPAGVVVTQVSDNSPAYDAGLQRGDVITKINETSITSVVQFNSEKEKYSPSDTITLEVYREGKSYLAKVTLGSANN